MRLLAIGYFFPFDFAAAFAAGFALPLRAARLPGRRRLGRRCSRRGAGAGSRAAAPRRPRRWFRRSRDREVTALCRMKNARPWRAAARAHRRSPVGNRVDDAELVELRT